MRKGRGFNTKDAENTKRGGDGDSYRNALRVQRRPGIEAAFRDTMTGYRPPGQFGSCPPRGATAGDAYPRPNLRPTHPVLPSSMIVRLLRPPGRRFGQG